MRVRSTEALEADLAALKRTAERAGTALACLFSSADEFEAEVIRARRAQGVFPFQQRARRRSRALGGALVVFLVLAFLLI